MTCHDLRALRLPEMRADLRGERHVYLSLPVLRIFAPAADHPEGRKKTVKKTALFLEIALYIAICAGAILLTKWLFESIVGSDLPLWLKYVLLK